MELKKQNGLPKLKKVNIVDPEKNTARTMFCCPSCDCWPKLDWSQSNFNGVYTTQAYEGL